MEKCWFTSYQWERGGGYPLGLRQELLWILLASEVSRIWKNSGCRGNQWRTWETTIITLSPNSLRTLPYKLTAKVLVQIFIILTRTITFIAINWPYFFLSHPFGSNPSYKNSSWTSLASWKSSVVTNQIRLLSPNWHVCFFESHKSCLSNFISYHSLIRTLELSK